ncbi:MFS transporter [Duganella sp. FT92W]|uniref:MFS transporter n=1 Tax=Pseudoduganella rivuli TaxID=2666085 RepID=A0A7X2II36_9BURK|nr:MFS transporter [Pseudoduganella rivuli]MRV70444.1 MFS transporter [Pseudoduganella rivuli]
MEKLMAGGIAPVPENRPGYPGWIVAVASMVALVFGPSTIAVLSFGLFIRPLEQEFGWSRTEIALASTFISYTIMLISPLHGYLTDRYGPRKIILPCIPLFALGLAMLYFLPPVHAVYYAAWIILPILGIGLFPLSYLQTVSTWFSGRLGLALGIANAGIGIGGVLLPLLIGFLINTYGWRIAFASLGAMTLAVSLPAAWLFVRERERQPGAQVRTAGQSGAAFGDAVRSQRFRLLVISFLILGFINTALVVHQVPLLADAGVPMARAVLVQSVYGMFVLIGRVITGFLIDRFAPALVMMGFVLGASLACALYALGVNNALVFIAAALFGLVFGAEFDVLSYLLKSFFGMKSFGRLYGLIFALFQFGAGCGAAFLPLSRAYAGGYALGMWVFCGMTMICALCLYRLYRCGDRQPAELAANATA